MIIIPAIDILDHQCVRLKEGDFAQKTVYFKNPVDAARHWKEEGAKRLHVVDLDGARAGRPINTDLVAQMVAVMNEGLPASKSIPVQVGGGIRDMASLTAYFNAGVHACILGTAAVSDKPFFTESCRTYPGKIIAGIDARGQTVAVEGWEKDGGANLFDLAKWVASVGAEAIIYTDINRDGMLSGVNLGDLEELATISPIPVIASGGVATIQDIEALMSSSANFFGVISGRALYQQTLSLAEAEKLIAQMKNHKVR